MGPNTLMNRFQSGAAAEMFVASQIARYGNNILWPSMTQSRYDFVYEDEDGKFTKVQVKKVTWSTSGNFKYLQARIIGKNKLTNTPYKSKDVDAFAFTDMERVWFAWFDEVGPFSSVCLDSTNPNYKPQTKYNPEAWLLFGDKNNA